MGLNKDNRCIAEPQPEDGSGDKPGSLSGCAAASGCFIAGGGTGGHLFPGIAIAEEFLRRNPSHRILFIRHGTGPRKEDSERAGAPPPDTLAWKGGRGEAQLSPGEPSRRSPGGLVASFRILREFGPDIVVGVVVTPRDRRSSPPGSWG